MSYPQDPGPPPGPGPWQQPPPGPGGPGPQPGYGPPTGGQPAGGYGYPPPGGYPSGGYPAGGYPGGQPTGSYPSGKGGGGNVGLVLVTISVCVAVLVVVGGVGLWLLSSSGGSGGTAEQSALAPYEGVWDGDLDQLDAGGAPMGTWSATVTVSGDTVEGEEYNLGTEQDGRCSWEISEVQPSDTQMTFSYSVADDPDCVDNGFVTLVPAGEGMLDITVSSTMSDGSTSVSEGTLYRE
ncbi:hypothetical protein HNR12_003351 [Streptomonospora nanhaiensis]|uniref:Uncharacterized protein n=1 Tax=Streptomonospora nanhaiensis TaxID=1323731 RepID=A0A853BQH3_9ACTN|nr:hypothetical protein [Streptomonospora nanhaiensis]NYI97074.1 hypothetical protein [Streptomonospora nanhaiensis]